MVLEGILPGRLHLALFSINVAPANRPFLYSAGKGTTRHRHQSLGEEHQALFSANAPSAVVPLITSGTFLREQGTVNHLFHSAR